MDMAQKQPTTPNNPRAARSVSPGSISEGWIVLAICIALYLAQSAALRNFTIDDIGISYRYALHLAEGKGLVWNLHGPRVEGYSNLLWVLILALVRVLGIEILAASKVLSSALGLVNLTLLYLICRRIWHGHRFWWLPVILVVATPEWIAWSVSGLEIAMAGTFLLVLILGMCRDGTGKVWLLAAGAVGLTLTRPEGAALAAVALLIACLGEKSVAWCARTRAYAIPVASLIVTVTGLIAFRLAYYGYLFPNTVYAKFETSLPSAGHVLHWIVLSLPLLVGHVIAWRARRPASSFRVLRAAFALTLVQMLVVLPVHPVMHFLHRYLIACLPLLTLSAPVYLTLARTRARWRQMLVTGILTLWMLQGWPSVVQRDRVEEYMFDRTRCVADQLLRLPGTPTVGIVDAGRIPYWTDLPAYDAWGLCDLELAHQGFEPETILKKRPDVYVMSARFTAEGRFSPHLGMDVMLMQTPAFAEQYGLWTFCPGPADTVGGAYDYAIFIQTDWARDHSFGM